MTTAVMSALRTKYAPPAYVMLEEVRNGTGYAKALRSADAVVMSVWPSRGIWTAGFEMKISRQDWQRELDNPAKAAAFYDYCDYWWLVAGDEKIVRPGELPKTWGLLVAKGGKLVMEVDAPLNEHVKPMDRLMLASMFRNFSEHYVPAVRVTDMAEELTKIRKAGEVKLLEQRLVEEKRRADTIDKSVEAFEEKSGIKITAYDGAHLGEGLRQYMGFGGMQGVTAQLERLKTTTEYILKQINDGLAAAEKAPR